MKHQIEQFLKKSIEKLQENKELPSDLDIAISIERTRDKQFGDYASNIALLLAKPCRMSPKVIAEKVIESLPENTLIKTAEVAGPGFINFYLNNEAKADIVRQIHQKGNHFGESTVGNRQKILLEFVSANPTGPLHVGHGRSAAFGATLANVLRAAGFLVDCEYYINDAGRQMNILALSTFIRYLELLGEPVVIPANAYKGTYVCDIAQVVLDRVQDTYKHSFTSLTEGLPADEPFGGDKEVYIDALIQKARVILGDDGFSYFHQSALDYVLNDIKDDLNEFGVHYQNWFSEQELVHDGSLKKAIDALVTGGHTYEKEGALWFRATDFGDEKDRVLVRSNGVFTYFATDAAYHWNKYDRGYDRVINIFGADHHGYITRIKSAVRALGHNDDALDILTVQFAILYKGGERVQMSTRSGSFVTLRELREEVGNDASRFFYVMRKPEQHMDFDLDLAVSQSSDNPVYYLQYAHARICSVLRQVVERGMVVDFNQGLDAMHLLHEPHEQELIAQLLKYQEFIELSAINCEPHLLAYYLKDLATSLHSYYNAVQLICADVALRQARLALLQAVRQVLHNGMQLMGIHAPEQM